MEIVLERDRWSELKIVKKDKNNKKGILQQVQTKNKRK